jgi:hypothetical protein
MLLNEVNECMILSYLIKSLSVKYLVLDIKPTAKEERQQLQESCDHKLVHDSGHWFVCTKCTHRVNLDSTLSRVKNNGYGP